MGQRITEGGEGPEISRGNISDENIDRFLNKMLYSTSTLTLLGKILIKDSHKSMT